MTRHDYKDAFGVPISEGDIILSAATKGGLLKIGRAVFRPNSLGVEIITEAGYRFGGKKKLDQVGSWLAVLRFADGSVPEHFAWLIKWKRGPIEFCDLPGMWEEADLIGGETDGAVL